MQQKLSLGNLLDIISKLGEGQASHWSGVWRVCVGRIDFGRVDVGRVVKVGVWRVEHDGLGWGAIGSGRGVWRGWGGRGTVGLYCR